MITTSRKESITSGVNVLKSKPQFRTRKRKGKRTVYPVTFVEALTQHDNRSLIARRTDEALEATKKVSPSEWVNNKNNTDVEGIDFFALPLSSSPDLALNYEANSKLVKYIMENKFNTKITAPVSYVPNKKTSLASYFPSKNKITLSKGVYNALRNGKLDTATDYLNYHSLFHEYLHAIYGDRSVYPAWLEESAVEISSHRVGMHNIQLSQELRKKLYTDPLEFVTYQTHIHKLADIALLVNKGDKERAVEWIDDMHTAKEGMSAYVSNGLSKLGYKLLSPTFVASDELKKLNITPTKDRDSVYPRHHKNLTESRYWYLYV